MDHCKDFIKSEFPSIDIEMFQYIEGKIVDRLFVQFIDSSIQNLFKFA